MNAPPRGFETSEFQARVSKAQKRMADAGLSALLLTTEPDVRYFTGFLTRFWESPTRPWYVVLPATGAPIAVIPSIGAALMKKTWIVDIRTWQAPDLTDDGLSILSDTLIEVVGEKGIIGVPSGIETHLRMPIDSYRDLKDRLGSRRIFSDANILRDLRMIKSHAEIAKIANACQIAGRAFARVPEIASEGVNIDQVFRAFQMLCLQEGADWVPYIAGGAGQSGYDDVISPATEAPLQEGDVLMLDTGLVWDGYFCDFDRNYAIAYARPTARDAYAKLIEATAAGLDAAKPGATAAEVFHAMDRIVTGGRGGSDAGRLGHGLGMQLTEGLSLIAQDHTVLEEGMVLTLEPGIETVSGRLIVHEENIVIRSGGAELLSPAAPDELPVI